MAGHSKWATTKRHKAVVDAKRGKIFSILSKEITLLARSGGGDQEFNPRLRMLVNKAKAANMPADNIDRAIKKGTGELPGVIIEELTYEGYATGGVGMIVEVTTDNKNRSASEVRSTFTKAGGNLATPGALSFSFQRLGQFLISHENSTEDQLMEVAVDAGADDIKDQGEYFEVLCSINNFDSVAKALEDKNIQTESSELAYIPTNLVKVSDKDAVQKILKLIGQLEDLEDVKSVWANFDIDEKLLSEE